LGKRKLRPCETAEKTRKHNDEPRLRQDLCLTVRVFADDIQKAIPFQRRGANGDKDRTDDNPLLNRKP
jgi:hypothetical protein